MEGNVEGNVEDERPRGGYNTAYYLYLDVKSREIQHEILGFSTAILYHLPRYCASII